MHLNQTEIQLIRDYFQGKPVNKVFLFGSYSRNEADENSDLDLLVELDYSKHIGLEFFGMKIDLEKTLHKKIDLVSAKGVSKYILPFIEKDKMLLYEK